MLDLVCPIHKFRQNGKAESEKTNKSNSHFTMSRFFALWQYTLLFTWGTTFAYDQTKSLIEDAGTWVMNTQKTECIDEQWNEFERDDPYFVDLFLCNGRMRLIERSAVKSWAKHIQQMGKAIKQQTVKWKE